MTTNERLYKLILERSEHDPQLDRADLPAVRHGGRLPPLAAVGVADDPRRCSCRAFWSGCTSSIDAWTSAGCCCCGPNVLRPVLPADRVPAALRPVLAGVLAVPAARRGGRGRPNSRTWTTPGGRRCAKLEAKGIGLADAPMYLILGRPAAGEDALFQAAEQQVAVRAPAAGRCAAAGVRQPGRDLRHLRRRLGVGPVRGPARRRGGRGRGRSCPGRPGRRPTRRSSSAATRWASRRSRSTSCANCWPSSSSAT